MYDFTRDHLNCDEPGCQRGLQLAPTGPRRPTANDTRQSGRHLGWRRIRSMDLCPKHAPKRLWSNQQSSPS